MKEYLDFIRSAKESGDFEGYIEKHLPEYTGDLNDFWFHLSVEPLTTDFLAAHKDDVVWRCVCKYSILPEWFMDDYSDYMDWLSVSERQNFGMEFTVKHKYDLDWKVLIMRFKYPQDLLLELIDDPEIQLDIGCVLQNQVLTRDQVERLSKVYAEKEIDRIRTERTTKVKYASNACEAMAMDA